jgi:hypothetical protein
LKANEAETPRSVSEVFAYSTSSTLSAEDTAVGRGYLFLRNFQYLGTYETTEISRRLPKFSEGSEEFNGLPSSEDDCGLVL